MKVPFSELPGRHERHFRRKLNNPFFPRPVDSYTDDELLEFQRLDHEELIEFIQQLQQLVVKATQLPPNVESDVILSLKEELDKAYETSAGLADDQSGNRFAIQKLTGVIMDAIRKGAAGDNFAGQELDQEDEARASHYRLLEHAVISDMLHPESLIMEDELTPTLMSESEEALAAALMLFDKEQLAEIVKQARQILADVENPGDAASRLEQMERHLVNLSGEAIN